MEEGGELLISITSEMSIYGQLQILYLMSVCIICHSAPLKPSYCMPHNFDLGFLRNSDLYDDDDFPESLKMIG